MCILCEISSENPISCLLSEKAWWFFSINSSYCFLIFGSFVGQLKCSSRYFRFWSEIVGIGPVVSLLPYLKILASSTGINFIFDVSITSPTHWEFFTNTGCGLLFVITTKILFCLSTFVRVSSKYTPDSIVFLFVITSDPGFSITLFGVEIVHFTFV